MAAGPIVISHLVEKKIFSAIKAFQRDLQIGTAGQAVAGVTCYAEAFQKGDCSGAATV